ncbi:MAG: hypothetical protein WAO98_08440 [Alphaproteobacteria bacterium]
MTEFLSMEEAIRVLTSKDSPLYLEFTLSAQETTRYAKALDRVTKLAEEFGAVDQTNGWAAATHYGGIAVAFIGACFLNPWAFGAGVLAAQKGTSDAKKTRSKNDQIAQRIERNINADPEWRQELQIISKFHTAINVHCQRCSVESPPKQDYYEVALPKFKHIREIRCDEDDMVRVAVGFDKPDNCDAFRPEKLSFRIADLSHHWG